MFDIPVVLLMFKRDKITQIIDRIREVKPGWYQGYHPETNFKTALYPNRSMAEKFLLEYVNNPNIKRAMAARERVARPAVSNFNTTQSPPTLDNRIYSSILNIHWF